MPSPFPGMNPYLENESVFRDFHQRLLPTLSDLLVPQVRPDYIVRVELEVYLTEPPGEERRFLGRPDAYLAPRKQDVGKPPSGTAVLESPARVRWIPPVDEEKHTFLEIRDRQDRSLVTVIELLSPTNKKRHRDAFMAKRLRYQEASVHYVEIDLLRGFGPRLPWEDLPPCDYYALVSRWQDRPTAAVWPFGLRDPLPTLPIPLKPDHADVRLDLKAVERVYDAAGYADDIYRFQPEPPLSEEDEVWAQGILSESGEVSR